MRLVYTLRNACRALLRPCAVEVVATLMGVQKGKEIDCNISLPLSLTSPCSSPHHLLLKDTAKMLQGGSPRTPARDGVRSSS